MSPEPQAVTALAKATATAIIGIDTLWGGDVMNPSGTGRFIADSWFSDEPLPRAYTHPTAAKLRHSGGVAGQTIDVCHRGHLRREGQALAPGLLGNNPGRLLARRH